MCRHRLLRLFVDSSFACRTPTNGSNVVTTCFQLFYGPGHKNAATTGDERPAPSSPREPCRCDYIRPKRLLFIYTRPTNAYGLGSPLNSDPDDLKSAVCLPRLPVDVCVCVYVCVCVCVCMCVCLVNFVAGTVATGPSLVGLTIVRRPSCSGGGGARPSEVGRPAMPVLITRTADGSNKKKSKIKQQRQQQMPLCINKLAAFSSHRAVRVVHRSAEPTVKPTPTRSTPYFIDSGRPPPPSSHWLHF